MGVVSDLPGLRSRLPSHSGLMTQPDSSVGNADVRFGSCPFCKGIIRLVMILGDRPRTRCAPEGFPHADERVTSATW